MLQVGKKLEIKSEKKLWLPKKQKKAELQTNRGKLDSTIILTDLMQPRKPYKKNRNQNKPRMITPRIVQ